VWHNGKALGKPKDPADAYTILKSLSNSKHEVITSVCFKSKEKTDVLFDVTTNLMLLVTRKSYITLKNTNF
jgi:septum formation protein